MSHGYFWLKPVIGTENPPSIIIPYDLPGRNGCFRISVHGKNVELETLSGTDHNSLDIASLCLSLDEDLKPLYKIARRDENFKWLIDEKKGRFLRSPSLFEDCLKAIFTINIQWKRSVQIAEAAVSKYGTSTGIKFEKNLIKACPTPHRLGKLDESKLRESLKAGFRAKFIHSLCNTAVDKPEIYLGSKWRELSSDDFCREIGSVSGMGPMSVAYVSRLYGKTNSYHMDSWVLRRCAALWGLSENQIEEHVKRRYGDFGELGPAVFWFELTRYWHYTIEESFELNL